MGERSLLSVSYSRRNQQDGRHRPESLSTTDRTTMQLVLRIPSRRSHLR
ncbi:hypothetical protein MLGJGCBP_07204 [Rhodococcus sp. T7]|nr:hypothetical protein MLGJGCBP_07204 [Rhodococcus sp. T7]